MEINKRAIINVEEEMKNEGGEKRERLECEW
jgi:hypothetical protein